jgi:tetratricopeptide (TPR) repeat protein
MGMQFLGKIIRINCIFRAIWNPFMQPRKNLLKYCNAWILAICLIAFYPVQIYAQDTTKKLIDLNQIKLVKKINSLLDSSQKKVKGDILNKANEVKKEANTQLNNTIKKAIPREEERPLPYERLLNTKYTLGRRAYQNTVSQFNYLFNGEEELKEIILKARNSYQENYSSLLSFYDYDLATTSKSSIDSIIYRCNANIVLHDLRSNWVDDAYLLLAKAYLFHKNFDTAGSILQFINYSFDEKDNGMDLPIGSNLRKTNGKFSIATKEANRAFENVNVRNESMVWQARNYFETNALNEGISLLQLLKADELFPRRLHPFLNEQLAYGYYLMESYENAAKYLVEALPNAPDDLAKSRWYYLIAQLWQKAENTDQAYKWYKKANDFSPNPIIGVYSKINMIRIEAKKSNSAWELLASDLERMTRREKYKPYIDIIYFEMAQLAIQNNAIKKANEWLVIAIKNNKSNLQQKQKAFELLGSINYEYDQYGVAKIAYDSLNNVLKTNPLFDQIVLRKKWMSTVQQQTINYQKEDSLQYIYSLPEADQAIYAKMWAKNQSQNALGLSTLFADKTIKALQYNEPVNTASINMNAYLGNNSGAADFYFDNKNTITQGKQSFVQKWGERPNVDQWRRKTSNNIINANAKTANNNIITLQKDTTAEKNNSINNKDSITYTLIKSKADFNNSLSNWNKAALTTAQTFLLQLNDFEKAKPIYQKIVMKNIDPAITERALLDMASQYLHDGEIEKSNSIIDVVNSRFPNGIYASKKLEVETKKNKDQNIVSQYKEAYFLSQIGDWNNLSKLANTINGDIRKTKWFIPFQFLKVKMYAQQKQDSIALLLLDSIILINKSDVIREKAKNIITELKNRKGTEAYLTSLQITKEQFTPELIKENQPKDSNNNLVVKENLEKVNSNKTLGKDSVAFNKNVSAPAIIFNNDSTEPHFVAFVTSNMRPMFVKEMQNSFSTLNSDEFPKMNLNTTFVQFQEGSYIVWIGPFENTQKSKQYLNRIKPRLKNELISFVTDKQYEMYILSKSNILLIKTLEDLKLYKEFMLNQIYKP